MEDKLYKKALFDKAIALHQEGKLDEAVETYKKAISLKPLHVKAYYNMGNALKDQGKLEEAIKYFNKALAIKPDYTEAYKNLILAGITEQEEERTYWEDGLPNT